MARNILTAMGAHRLEQDHIDGATAKLAIIDAETTGLDPVTDEVIGLAIVCVAVDRASGRLLGISDRYAGQREPQRPMSALAEKITGLQYSQLVGRRLDEARITEMVAGCELVVAHCASFDRQFVEPCLPVFEHLAWACSLTEIDWRGTECQPKASIAYLLSLHGMAEGERTPQADCDALAHVLGRPLPVSGRTGFAALLDAAKQVQLRVTIPDPHEHVVALLQEKGFSYHPDLEAWQIGTQEVVAWQLEGWLVDLAVYDAAIDRFSVERIDATRRFSGR